MLVLLKVFFENINFVKSQSQQMTTKALKITQHAENQKRYFFCFQPSGSGHFSRRHLWLDDLPPFTGTQSIQKTCRYLVHAGHKAGIQTHQLLQCHKTDDVCTCFLCNEDLLKLQVW